MGRIYPDLNAAVVASIIVGEEQAFRATLQPRLGAARQRRRARPKAPAAARSPGDRAFELHDTFGFPFELTLELAADAGLTDRRGRVSAG